MTTPMIETLRNIPLIVEKDIPMEAEDTDSGFPFDRDDRDQDFRSQLDDIAKRHPEFAEHLDGFPFRSDSLGRRRPPRPTESEFRRFTDRPFGSARFQRFFTDPFEDEFEEPKQQEQTQTRTSPKQQEVEVEVDKPQPQRSRRQQNNIQQSNTVDLGQKQEPVNDRNQRSMSAPPPDNRPRYVSSINIPINRDGGMGEMGQAQTQPQQQQPQQQDKPVERVIPIHVEGRDEPVVPKHTGPSYSQPQPERVFGGQPQTERVFRPQPEPERIFGHRPSHFTQYVGREPPKQQQQQQQFYEPEVKQKQAPPQQQQQQQQPPQPQPKPEEQPPQPTKSTTPIDIIQSIQKDVSELMNQVEKFNGVPKDKQYLYLDEMLTRNLIKLDNVDTQGQENIRQARKEAIKCIESCIGILEAKAAANVPQETKPVEGSNIEEAPKESQNETEKMEVEVKGSGEPEKVEEKMEVAPTTVEDKSEDTKMETSEETKIEVVAPPPQPETPKEEQKEVSESKPTTDEEMKVVPTEEVTVKEEDTEKKKGKKKDVKK